LLGCATLFDGAALIGCARTSATPPALTQPQVPTVSPLRPVVAQPDDVALFPFGNSGGTQATHLPNAVQSFAVRKRDSAIVAAAAWDEGTHEVSIIRNGVAIATCGAMMGWGARSQGYAATNSNHIYAGLMIQGEAVMQHHADIIAPPIGTAWWGFAVYDDNCAVPGPHSPLYANFVKLWETVRAPKGEPSTDTPLTGLAANESRIYAAIASLNKVFTVDAQTLKLLGATTLPSPGALAADASGHVWALTSPSSGTSTAVQLDINGSPTGKQIPNLAGASFLGTGMSDELLITFGASRTVTRYDPARSLLPSKTWSPAREPYDGLPGPFKWRGTLQGATTDANGDLVVVWAEGAHDIYECYSPADKLLWQNFALVGDEATAPILNADHKSADVYGPTDVFTIHFETNPPTWTWKGHTIDASTNLAANASVMVQDVAGRRLVLKTSHIGSGAATLLAHSAGTVLTPVATLQADGPNWYWHLEPSGDLTEVMINRGFYYFSFRGYDPSGAPTYSKSPLIVPPDPHGDPWGGSNKDSFDRVMYDQAHDLLIVAGHTVAKPRADTWGEFRVVVAYSGFGDFLHGKPLQLGERWRLDLPYPPDFAPLFAKNPGYARGLWIVGDTLLVQFQETESIVRYRLDTAAYLDQYTPSVSSWNDVNTGLQGIALPDGRMLLTILSITQESALGVIWKTPNASN
jgi:hypothetical protein